MHAQERERGSQATECVVYELCVLCAVEYVVCGLCVWCVAECVVCVGHARVCARMGHGYVRGMWLSGLSSPRGLSGSSK